MSSAALSASRARVLSGYRRLFRARKLLFEGDYTALAESRLAIKSEFVKNKEVATTGDHFEGLLGMVDEAEDMLRHGFVRGKLNPESGNYEVKIKPEHAEGPDKPSPIMEPVTPEIVSEMEQNREQRSQEKPVILKTNATKSKK